MIDQPHTIALFGGAFDPPHRSHEIIIHALTRMPSIDLVQIIPYHQSALGKQPHASPQDRMAMLQLLIEDESKCVINDIEIQNPTISYTIDTLKQLRSRYPKAILFWVLSSESLASFNQWKDPDAIFAICHLICFKRVNQTEMNPSFTNRFCEHFDECTESESGNIWVLPTPLPPFSSSSIREAIKNHQHPIEGLNPKVASYIRQHQLYQEDSP